MLKLIICQFAGFSLGVGRRGAGAQQTRSAAEYGTGHSLLMEAGVAARPAAESRRGKSLERLRGAARALFVAHGYDRTRPQDIAKAAGVANGTFYLHFADKKAAFMDFAREAQNDFLRACDEHLEALPREARFAGFFDVVEAFSKVHPGVLQVAFVDPVTIDPNDDGAWELYDRMGEYVARRLARRLPGAGDLGLLSHGICGLIRHSMTYAARRRVPRDVVVAELARFLDGGLRAVQSTPAPGLPASNSEQKDISNTD